MNREPFSPGRAPLVVLAACLVTLTPAVGQSAALWECWQRDVVECFIIYGPGIPDPVRDDLLDAWRFAQRLLCTSTSPEDVRVGMWTSAGCEGVGTGDVKGYVLP